MGDAWRVWTLFLLWSLCYFVSVSYFGNRSVAALLLVSATAPDVQVPVRQSLDLQCQALFQPFLVVPPQNRLVLDDDYHSYSVLLFAISQ